MQLHYLDLNRVSDICMAVVLTLVVQHSSLPDGYAVLGAPSQYPACSRVSGSWFLVFEMNALARGLTLASWKTFCIFKFLFEPFIQESLSTLSLLLGWFRCPT